MRQRVGESGKTEDVVAFFVTGQPQIYMSRAWILEIGLRPFIYGFTIQKYKILAFRHTRPRRPNSLGFLVPSSPPSSFHPPDLTTCELAPESLGPNP